MVREPRSRYVCSSSRHRWETELSYRPAKRVLACLRSSGPARALVPTSVRHVVYDVSHGASQIVEGRERFVTLGPKRFVVVLEPDGLPTEIVRRVFKAQQLVRPLDSPYQGLEETPALFEQLRHAERRVRIHRAGAGIPPSRRRGWPSFR